MYFTAQLLSHIAFETNRKATQSLYSNLATTAAEIEVLIGMLITMGICEMPRYRMYWANQTHSKPYCNFCTSMTMTRLSWTETIQTTTDFTKSGLL
ncbi:hypothetical protein T4B_13228 [Trichinella pseudospiralis]|uniref:PiggyBac transposable element-derived protein domain-containing protein n=1 Tax=Trichinella pseudospiralis TaxID=6337 RepID=A0A0V1GB22_TRIPS|nr:hypothetical protein T4B_13228 [Trichinella pseudospiralis]